MILESCCHRKDNSDLAGLVVRLHIYPLLRERSTGCPFHSSLIDFSENGGERGGHALPYVQDCGAKERWLRLDPMHCLPDGDLLGDQRPALGTGGMWGFGRPQMMHLQLCGGAAYKHIAQGCSDLNPIILSVQDNPTSAFQQKPKRFY